MARSVLNWGIFKELHHGSVIYWAGKYNVEGGSKEFNTLGEAREYIDKCEQDFQESQRKEKQKKIDAGTAIAVKRVGDTVTAYTPDGEKQYTIRQWRNSGVWETEEKYDKEVAYID